MIVKSPTATTAARIATAAMMRLRIFTGVVFYASLEVFGEVVIDSAEVGASAFTFYVCEDFWLSRSHFFIDIEEDWFSW